MSMIRLTYVSIREDMGPNTPSDIQRASEAYNAAHGLTGALIATDENFAHALEGEANEVAVCLSRVTQDARHRRVRLTSVAEIRTRLFASQRMCVCAGGDIQKLLLNLPSASTHAPISDWTPRSINLMFRRLASLLEGSLT